MTNGRFLAPSLALMREDARQRHHGLRDLFNGLRSDVTRGVVLLPRRFRRPARDQERLADDLKGLHLIAFTMLMGKPILPVLSVL